MLACKCSVPCEAVDGLASCLWTKPADMSWFDYTMNLPTPDDGTPDIDYWERLYIALDVGVN